ncbi:uncharacterized protein LOC125040310 [Penaeus chinensis]|uniref:uncharacterized protein LOC125040310 n=1 Tax=Penaeus chinensis TaxID=139456 RepID=UPI001FB622C2|nr:uncharacterized protein LOC125040310 [Penaeus chinensis]
MSTGKYIIYFLYLGVNWIGCFKEKPTILKSSQQEIEIHSSFSVRAEGEEDEGRNRNFVSLSCVVIGDPDGQFLACHHGRPNRQSSVSLCCAPVSMRPRRVPIEKKTTTRHTRSFIKQTNKQTLTSKRSHIFTRKI